ncbi:hypothetical protein [Pseudomonas sp. BIC9C]|uniref:hypothetical protein n=1 Tax=Pseudomonas sp. BIC9C TaxID=3078458 RepID=UPI002AD356FF|nr:hypothetical protein [Pseudomonas sp. BIC9C]
MQEVNLTAFKHAFQIETAIAGKPAPTGTEYSRKKLVGWQAAIASKLAPTEEQSKAGRRTPALLFTTQQAER